MNDYEGYKAYKVYVALRAHFTGSYDYIKYNGKMKVNETSFLKRKDRFFFAKIDRKYKDELVNFFVANFVKDSGSWSGSLTGDNANEVYKEWTKKIDSISYRFREDVKHIAGLGSFPSVYSGNSSHPIILKEYLGNRILLETMCIFNSIAPMNWNLDDILWNDTIALIKNYTPFLNIDKRKYARIMREEFDDNN